VDTKENWYKRETHCKLAIEGGPGDIGGGQLAFQKFGDFQKGGSNFKKGQKGISGLRVRVCGPNLENSPGIYFSILWGPPMWAPV